jgi:hypothetical protein
VYEIIALRYEAFSCSIEGVPVVSHCNVQNKELKTYVIRPSDNGFEVDWGYLREAPWLH